MPIETLLKQTDFFLGLSSESRDALAAICVRKALKKKETLFREGMSGTALYLLAHGAIQLRKTTPDGREAVIRVIKPGEIFAEVILFEKDRYPVTATALKNSVIYAIPKSRFHVLLNREDFRSDFIRGLFEKHRYLTNQLTRLNTASVEERFFFFLREQYGEKALIVPAISKKDLAAAIGTTPETLSRLLLKLKKKKLLEWKDKEILFLKKVAPSIQV
ncbi:MAG TPA: Crp/Fnr family transcriptional regulator [Candidatus Omnitrophota bacterium]|nr:Crp/Fnr family transcriptional regulator [Candidatus Omnitrophota bacterium]